MRALLDEDGNLKPINEVGDDIGWAVSSVKVTERVEVDATHEHQIRPASR